MNELLSKATQGVDLSAPGAFWHVFANLLNMVPWGAIFWWNVLFVAVGALLGWWKGRLLEGIAWAWILGPIGWLIVVFKPSVLPPIQPPPLPR